MLELTLTVSSWDFCHNIPQNVENGDAQPVPLVSSRWLAGVAAVDLVESDYCGPARDIRVVTAARQSDWTIHSGKNANANGDPTAIQSETDRPSGLDGLSEISADSGYVEVFALDARSFEWIVRSFKASKGQNRSSVFDVEQSHRGNLHLTSMAIGKAERT